MLCGHSYQSRKSPPNRTNIYVLPIRERCSTLSAKFVNSSGQNLRKLLEIVTESYLELWNSSLEDDDFVYWNYYFNAPSSPLVAFRRSYIPELAKNPVTRSSCSWAHRDEVCGISQHQHCYETLLYLGPVIRLRSVRICLCRNNIILSSLNHLDPAEWLWFRANHFACFFISNLPFFNMVKIQDKI